MIYADEFERDLREKIARRLLRNMLTLQAAHKKNLSKSNPRPHNNPAPKGDFPRGRTWNLRDCVVVDPPSVKTIMDTLFGRTGVLVNAEYGYWLEQNGWKGLLDTHAMLKASGAYS